MAERRPPLRRGEAVEAQHAGPAEDCQPHLAVELNGHPTLRLPNTANLTFPGIESEALLLLLDQEGLCASSGSACLADSNEPSHVVKAMKPESAAARQMIRFSLGRENTAVEVEAAIGAVRRCLAALGS